MPRYGAAEFSAIPVRGLRDALPILQGRPDLGTGVPGGRAGPAFGMRALSVPGNTWQGRLFRKENTASMGARASTNGLPFNWAAGYFATDACSATQGFFAHAALPQSAFTCCCSTNFGLCPANINQLSFTNGKTTLEFSSSCVPVRWGPCSTRWGIS